MLLIHQAWPRPRGPFRREMIPCASRLERRMTASEPERFFRRRCLHASPRTYAALLGLAWRALVDLFLSLISRPLERKAERLRLGGSFSGHFDADPVALSLRAAQLSLLRCRGVARWAFLSMR